MIRTQSVFVRRLLLALVLFAGTYFVTTSDVGGQSQDLQQLMQQFASLYRSGDFSSAIEAGKRVLTLAERELGPRHRMTGNLKVYLGETYRSAARFPEAEGLLKD